MFGKIWNSLLLICHTPISVFPSTIKLASLTTPTEPVPPCHFPPPVPGVIPSAISFPLRVHEAPCMRAWEPCKGDPSFSFAASSTLSPRRRRRPLKPLHPARPLQEVGGSSVVGDARGELLPQTARLDRRSPSRACKGRGCWLHPRARTPSCSCRLLS